MMLAASLTYAGPRAAKIGSMGILDMESTVVADLSRFGLPAPAPASLYFVESDNRVSFTWRGTPTVLDAILRIFSWVRNEFQLKVEPRIKALKDECGIAHIAGEPVSILAQLTNEYRNTRRDIANAASRGRRIERQIAELQGTRIPENQTSGMGDGALRELELAEQIRNINQKIKEERAQLRSTEKILEDVLRECERPVVVPELIECDRVELVPFNPAEYVEPFFSATGAHPELYTYLPFGPFSSKDEFVEKFLDGRVQPDPSSILFAVLNKTEAGKELAAVIGLLNASTQNLSAELGFVITFPAFQGTHVTRCGAALLLRLVLGLPAEGGLGLRRAVWQANSGNERSIRVAERMGFKREALLRWDRALRPGKEASGNGMAVREGDPRPEAVGRDTVVLASRRLMAAFLFLVFASQAVAQTAPFPAVGSIPQNFTPDGLEQLWDIVGPVQAPPFTTTYVPTSTSVPLPSPPPPLYPSFYAPAPKDVLPDLKFPPDFKFGVDTAAYQVEGAVKNEGKGPTLWDWNSRQPGGVFDNTTADVVDLQYYLYKEDVLRVAALGVNAHSFSISWARILPFGTKDSPVNQAGLDHYSDLINYHIAHGVEPVATLFHWDTPLALAAYYGGFTSPQIVDDFVNYAKIVFQAYNGRVKTWYTFNEPRVYCSEFSAYPFNATLAPGVNASMAPYICSYYLLKAHVGAVKAGISPDLLGETWLQATPNPLRSYLQGLHQRWPTNKMYISEFGFMEPLEEIHTELFRITEDVARTNYYMTYLGQILLSIHEDGVPIAGAFAWAMLDNAEWNIEMNITGEIAFKSDDFIGIPWRANNTDDTQAVERHAAFRIGVFADPLYTTGDWPTIMTDTLPPEYLPRFTEEEKKDNLGAADFFAIDAYREQFVSAPLDPGGIAGCVDDMSHPLWPECQNVVMYDSNAGWAAGISPDLLGETWLQATPNPLRSYLQGLHQRWPTNKMYISEFGFMEPLEEIHTELFRITEDVARTNYYMTYLGQILLSIHEDGVPIAGAFAWAMLDNAEWNIGLSAKFGIQYVNYTTLERVYKRSALSLSEFFTAHLQD
uniref:Glycoside hydrolase family 1 protein n=1 Tax=Mycena chlorophos TaxID=658473 RepID=A0ABQ0MBC7_MYCCL|nr:glycoside hydrolase family 1 protein [Mycena chlorophos]